jgi:hypothetical protein
VVGLKSFQVDRDSSMTCKVWVERDFGTVDEFVALKASEINGVQQTSTSDDFSVAESKGVPSRIFG